MRAEARTNEGCIIVILIAKRALPQVYLPVAAVARDEYDAVNALQIYKLKQPLAQVRTEVNRALLHTTFAFRVMSVLSSNAAVTYGFTVLLLAALAIANQGTKHRRRLKTMPLIILRSSSLALTRLPTAEAE